MTPFLKSKRRTKGIDLETFTVSLPTALVDELERNDITARRGAGNLSVFLEIAAYIALGLFVSPGMAYKNLVRLIRNDSYADSKRSSLAENLEETVKLLVD